MICNIRSIEKGAAWDQAEAVCIFFHGFGADAADVAPIAEVLPELGCDKKVRFIFPEAPFRLCEVEEMPGQFRSWYDYERWFPTVKVKETVDDAIMTMVNHMLFYVRAHGFSDSKIILGGFSQGAAIVLDAVAKQDLAMAGLIALSCDFPLLYADRPTSVMQNVFFGHGTMDTMVPCQEMEDVANQYKANGHTVTAHTYFGLGHSIARRELRDVSEFIKRVLSA